LGYLEVSGGPARPLRDKEKGIWKKQTKERWGQRQGERDKGEVGRRRGRERQRAGKETREKIERKR